MQAVPARYLQLVFDAGSSMQNPEWQSQGLRHLPGTELLSRHQWQGYGHSNASAHRTPIPTLSHLQRPASWCCTAWQSFTWRDCRGPQCCAGDCQQSLQLRCSTASGCVLLESEQAGVLLLCIACSLLCDAGLPVSQQCPNRQHS